MPHGAAERENTMTMSNEQFFAARDAAPGIAERAAREIVCVTRSRLPTGGYRYRAVMPDGTSQLIRAKSTTSYTAAHLHSEMVCTGKTGLGSVISFGQKPTSPSLHIKSFAIVDATEAN